MMCSPPFSTIRFFFVCSVANRFWSVKQCLHISSWAYRLWSATAATIATAYGTIFCIALLTETRIYTFHPSKMPRLKFQSRQKRHKSVALHWTCSVGPIWKRALLFVLIFCCVFFHFWKIFISQSSFRLLSQQCRRESVPQCNGTKTNLPASWNGITFVGIEIDRFFSLNKKKLTVKRLNSIKSLNYTCSMNEHIVSDGVGKQNGNDSSKPMALHFKFKLCVC